MLEFHFLRPGWLLLIIPFLAIGWRLFTHHSGLEAWSKICDPHLLNHLLQKKSISRRRLSIANILVSVFFMVIAMAGPTWSRYPVPTFKETQPRVVVLNMSSAMLANDLPPNRLARAKFKLHDLFNMQDAGQFAMVVYTNEPFVVSPLTDDTNTIKSLLSSLSTEIMPIQGQRLDLALKEANQLIHQAGFKTGDILVLSPTLPSKAAIKEAAALSKEGIYSSIMPIISKKPDAAAYKNFASAGEGKIIEFSDTSNDLAKWLDIAQKRERYTTNLQNDVPIWKDEGRWFLIPALLLILPAFRRGWLQRIAS